MLPYLKYLQLALTVVGIGLLMASIVSFASGAEEYQRFLDWQYAYENYTIPRQFDIETYMEVIRQGVTIRLEVAAASAIAILACLGIAYKMAHTRN